MPAALTKRHGGMTTMRWFGGVVAGVALLTGLNAIFFWFSPWRFPKIDAIVAGDWYRYKEKIAGETRSPRLVAIGGSNGLYDLNTRRIEEKTGIRAVNFSTNYHLDLRYLLHKAERTLRPGDTALLSLEYEYHAPPRINDITIGAVMLDDRAYFCGLPWHEKLAWVWSEPLSSLTAARAEPPGRMEWIRSCSAQILREHFNDHADYCGHRKSARTQEQFDHLRAFGPLPLESFLSYGLHSGAWSEIGRFVNWCRSRGIRVIATFPPTVAYPEYDTPGARRALDGIVRNYQALGVPTLGTPRDFLWGADEFYDTNYHLTEEAMMRRTDIVVELLKPHIENPSAR